VQSACRGHDQASDKAAEDDSDDHDDDRRDDARDVADKLGENVRQRLQAERVGGDQHHREHHEPEDETRSYARWVHTRTRSLDRLHHAALLEHLSQTDPPHQPVGALLEQSRQQIAGKENDQRAEERGHVAIELLEASL